MNLLTRIADRESVQALQLKLAQSVDHNTPITLSLEERFLLLWLIAHVNATTWAHATIARDAEQLRPYIFTAIDRQFDEYLPDWRERFAKDPS